MATRGTQIADARSLLDEPTEAFYLNSELVRWLNEADVILSTEVEPYEFSSTVNIVGSQAGYSAPSGCVRIKAVYVNGNLLTRIDLLDEATYTNYGIANATIQSQGNVQFWRHFGNKIVLFPTPTQSATAGATTGLKFVYYGTPPSISLASSGTSSQIPLNYHDAPAYYAAYKGKLKRQEYDKAKALLDLFKGRVTDAKRQWNPRDRSGFQTVRDTDDLVFQPFLFERP